MGHNGTRLKDVFNLNNDTMTTEQNEIKSAEWRKKNLSKNSFLANVSGSAIIADFMGVKEKELTFESYGKPTPFWYSGYLGYRTPAYSVPGKSLDHLLNENKFLHSWDWLLPVYRKIRDIINDRAKLDKHTRTKGDLLELDAQMAICEVDIQKAFDSIVAFIKWYNTSLADR